jgi:hypothetical protein
MNFMNVLFWDAAGSGGIVLTSKAANGTYGLGSLNYGNPTHLCLAAHKEKIVTHNVGAQTCNTFN